MHSNPDNSALRMPFTSYQDTVDLTHDAFSEALNA